MQQKENTYEEISKSAVSYLKLEHPFILFPKQRTGTGNALYFAMLSIIVMPCDRVWKKYNVTSYAEIFGGKVSGKHTGFCRNFNS